MNYLKAALAGVAVLAFAGIVNAQQGGKVVISTPNAPEAIGPYSQAIQVGNTLYLAGQVAIDPKTKKMMKDASIEEQTKQVLENLKAVLEAAGMTMDNVVSSSVFMQDLNDFKAMNGVYATYFTKMPPARATVQVARLPLDAKIEISLIAVK
ncbi:MAG: RidA family protein [Xanthobacteraceae bacterium]|nr:RidA family protein [Xanthobacteraceae bacterium]QYK45525.1 MAG: RidA family protein [Xanthobacteraceae bacterium]